MSKKDYAFREEIEKLGLSEVERLLVELRDDMRGNHDKIDACLHRRKYLLRDIFENTPENVEGLRRMALLIRERVAMLHAKGNELCEQMYEVWGKGENTPFTDFYVELVLRICFNDEDSVLRLGDDASGSDYVAMAEILSDFYDERYFPGNLMSSSEMHYGGEREAFAFFDCDGKVDDWGEQCFFGEIPESQWRTFPIVYEFHILLDDTHYALQDIIRINDVWSEAKVVWQHIAR